MPKPQYVRARAKDAPHFKTNVVERVFNGDLYERLDEPTHVGGVAIPDEFPAPRKPAKSNQSGQKATPKKEKAS